MPEIFNPVIPIVEVKDECVVAPFRSVQHQLAVAPQMVVPRPADEHIVSALGASRHLPRISEQKVIEFTSEQSGRVRTTNQNIVSTARVAGHIDRVAVCEIFEIVAARPARFDRRP